MVDLSINCLGIKFENPYLLASAPPTALVGSIDQAFSLGWAGAVLKTITPDNLVMNEASPRYATLKSGKKIIGLENIELLSHQTIKYWCDGISYLKQKHPHKVIIASIMAPVIKEGWQDLVQTLNSTPIDAFELNFSCPHGMPEQGIGMAIGTSREISAQITSWVKEVSQKPVFVKLSPNVTDIVSIGKAVEEAGADGLAAINTVQGLMGVDIDTFEPQMSVDGCSTYGGLSGKIIKPIGLRCCSQLRSNSNLPILGMGGICDWKDAVEYMAVGANLVQICTEVMISGYSIISDLVSSLSSYLGSKSLTIQDIHNIAIPKIKAHESLNKSYKIIPKIDKSKCIICGKCAKICSESEHAAICVQNKSISIDKSKCCGCSLCSHICPQEAISMQRE